MSTTHICAECRHYRRTERFDVCMAKVTHEVWRSPIDGETRTFEHGHRQCREVRLSWLGKIKPQCRDFSAKGAA